MGFVLLGLVTLHEWGVSGAVLQMFSHGIIAGLLFGIVGRLVYDRAHTRELEELAALRLSRRLPFAAVAFVLASLASMGLPGFSGFVAELSVLIGAWHSLPLAVAATGVGIVVGVAYLLRAMQQAFYGGGAPPADPDPGPPAALEPITLPERLGVGLLLATTVVVGLFPSLLLDYIVPSVRTLMGPGSGGGAS
jgi:NADH-quinone oxidoreductase subunit M